MTPMRRRPLLALPCLAAPPALAQRAPARVGWLTTQREASLAPFLPALRVGIAETGLPIELLMRFGDDDPARALPLMEELLRERVQVLIVQGAAVGSVLRARPSVPVVFVISSDPVAAGLAESLARPMPGSTGVTLLSPQLNAKRVELLRELLPEARSLALLANPNHPGEALEREAVRDAASRLGFSVSLHHAGTRPELDAAFAAIRTAEPSGLLVSADGFALQNGDAIAGFALSRRLPLLTAWRAFAEAGALLTYGPILADSYRRLGNFVVRILRGARPEQLPIEQPRSFELVLNQRSAAALGLTLPISLLARADLVLE